MTGEISANEIAPSINLAAGPAGFNIRTNIDGPVTVGPGGVITVQTKVNEADRIGAHKQNNRGNEKFANKHQKQVPVGSHSRLPIIARRALAGHQQFSRLYAKYAPTLSRQPQMGQGQNAFERNREKLWGLTNQAITRIPLTSLATTSFGCLSQGTRDKLTQQALLTGARSAPDGTFIERRKPAQPAAAQANVPTMQPAPKVGIDRRQASRAPTQNARSPLMEAYARLAKSGLMLGNFDGPRYKGQA